VKNRGYYISRVVFTAICRSNIILVHWLTTTVVRFQVLPAANVKMSTLWYMASCSLIEVDRRFSRVWDYTAPYPRRLSSLYNLCWRHGAWRNFIKNTETYKNEVTHNIKCWCLQGVQNFLTYFPILSIFKSPALTKYGICSAIIFAQICLYLQ
jgi:hypothetical protein